MAGLFLVVSLGVAWPVFDWSIVRLFVIVCGLPLAWAASVLLSRKESFRIDLERGVVVSGAGKREAPLQRLFPLEVRQPLGFNEGGGKSRLPLYQVIAKGWSRYVLYQSASKKRADARARALTQLLNR
jgi:hypothetical protein